MDIPLTAAHLRSLLDFIGRQHGVNESASEADLLTVLTDFRQWSKLEATTSRTQDYGRFAAFMATEVANGRLNDEEHAPTRLKVALELLLHVVLEGNLQQLTYEIGFDTKRVANLLASSATTVDDVFKALVRRGVTGRRPTISS